MSTNYENKIYNDYNLILSENERLEIENALLRDKNSMLQVVEAKIEKLKMLLENQKKEKELLAKEILRLKGLLNTDGSNSGIPTSKTPLSKNKIIPNSREKTGKKIGGQIGHRKTKLESFNDNEVTEIQEHNLEECPHCGGDLEKLDQEIHKDELDYKVVVIKRRNIFSVCKCKNCGRDSHVSIPNKLKEANQYGSGVCALALSLMNIGNVSVNKVRKMIYGLSEEEINPSEGYIIKQQNQAYKALIPFLNDLKQKCLSLETVYWDDTVISINSKRGCLRFYGDDKTALYVAHQRKNKEGLDKDGILKLLSSDTVVMHDHNKINYNKEYSFNNIECNAHLLRDLQKNIDYRKRNWSVKLKDLLTKTNIERNKALKSGKDAFSDAYVKDFYDKFDLILLEGLEESKVDSEKYFGNDERALLRRILQYKDNYFSWVVNFSLAFTNNLSERALRGIKSKMKISGQFKSVETAEYYAAIKSYIETSYRNGINETKALIRLCEGNPYTISEIFNSSKNE